MLLADTSLAELRRDIAAIGQSIRLDRSRFRGLRMVHRRVLRLDATMRRHLVALALPSILSCAGGGDGRPSTQAWDEDTSGDAFDSSSDAPIDPSDASTGTTTSASTVDPSDESTSDDMPVPDTAIDTCPRIRVVTPPDEPLNVRPDPSTAGEPIGSLGNGTLVEVIDQVQGESIEGNTLWFHIVYLGGEGYVSGVFAECTQEQPPEPPDGYYMPFACGAQVTCTQGNMGELSHNGLHAYAFDFGVGLDTPLVAMADGTVTLVVTDTVPGDPCYDGGGPECGPLGNEIVVQHGDGYSTMFKHINSALVGVGEVVTRGQPIALSGTTGYSTGPHLHVMLTESCGQYTCQSVPLSFVEAGVPVEGDVIVSQNCP